MLRRRFSSNVTVINNGIDTNIFYSDKDKEYISLKGNSKVVLIFARSDFRKGFDLAVEVLKCFKDQIDKGKIAVWAVGENLFLPFPVRNFGIVPPEILRKIISSADVFLYPSRHEGLPLFILEAMACGCPVVTTTASNVAKDGFNALVCPIEDVKCLREKLRMILSERNLVNVLINNARHTALRYSINTASVLFEERLKQFANG